jgi:hypothetical protein
VPMIPRDSNPSARSRSATASVIMSIRDCIFRLSFFRERPRWTSGPLDF